MTIDKAITIAVKEGWMRQFLIENKWELIDDNKIFFNDIDSDMQTAEITIYEMLWDINFWKSFADGLKLPELVCNNCGRKTMPSGHYYRCQTHGLLVEEDFAIKSYLRMMNMLVDFIDRGYSIEEYFATEHWKKDIFWYLQ